MIGSVVKSIKLYLILMVLLFLFSCNLKSANKDFIIVTSTPTLKSIIEEITDNITVYSILTGKENPHAYDLKPKDIVYCKKADLIIMNGYIDDWMLKFKDKKIIVLKDYCNVINENPHYWFDIDCIIKFVNSLDEYIKINTTKRKLFINKLERLKEKYDLSGLKVISVYPTFLYLYKIFNITNVYTLVKNPNEGFSLKELVKIKNINADCVVSNSLFHLDLNLSNVINLVPFVGINNISSYTELLETDLKLLSSCKK